MKIVRLEAANVKRLSAIEITPEGNLIVIGGKNGAGKTSVLDSIWYALGGKGAVCDLPLRKGEKHGHVTLALDSGLVVRRTFTEAGGGVLTVENGDGAQYKSPQKMLDALVGSMAFDPLEFARMKPAEQLGALQALVGLDVSDLDEQHAEVYEERAAINRDGKRAAAAAEAMPFHPDAPEAEVSLVDLVAERDAILEHNANVATLKGHVDEKRGWLDRANAELAAAESGVRAAEEALRLARETLATANEQSSAADSAFQDALAEWQRTEPRSTRAVDQQVASAEDTNRKVRENAARVVAEAEVSQLREQSQALTMKLQSIANWRAARIASAEFPVEEIGLADGGVSYNGIPFAQASAAEQMRASVAMGLAMNPQLRVLLVRDGSLLDEDALRMVAEMASEADAQVWLERVGDGEEVQVVIEDGAVRGAASAESAEDAASDG